MESSGPEAKRMRVADTSKVSVEEEDDLNSIKHLEKITYSFNEKTDAVPAFLNENVKDKNLNKPTEQVTVNDRENEGKSNKEVIPKGNLNCTDTPGDVLTQSTKPELQKEDPLNVNLGKTIASNADKKLSAPQSMADFRSSLQNGSGQKLESIIDRLSFDRIAPAANDCNDEALLCKADASTQTFPDFVKIVKCLVFRRMKQLEQSLIGDAVTDSVLNGKLIELQKENRELRKNARRLQEKLDAVIQSVKMDENLSSTKVKEALDSVSIQSVGMEVGSTSPIRKQSAVVSPYHVQKATGDSSLVSILNRDIPTRARAEVIEISVSSPKTPTPSSTGNESGKTGTSFLHQSSSVSRQGPQVKYVPQRMNPGPSSAPPSQFIHLGQNGVIMPKVNAQRSRAVGMEFVARAPGQVIYTTQPVQVTGPRMSTIPPQQQQANQHTNQRPMISPSGMGTRLSQPGPLSRPGSNLVRLSGSSAQTVHYIPQNVMPGYMTPIPHNLSPSGHRIVSQGPPSEMRPPSDIRQQVPANGLPQTVLHSDYRVRPGATGIAPPQLPPPPYQMTRMPTETVAPPKLQVNITVSGNGIVLSWDFETDPPSNIPAIDCYHLFASQDSPNPPTLKSEWKKIGVVKALPLPMACTLTQFVSGNSYHFAVLPVDVNGREGQMSNPCTVRLNN